jgi:hypothetical protein
MPWNTLAAADIETEILPDEVALLNTIQGSSGILASVLANALAEIQAQILVGGNQVGQSGTIPDQIRSDCIAFVRWRWFTSLPKTDLCSDFRKAQYEQALTRFEKIRSNGKDKEFVEVPTNPNTAVSGPGFQSATVRRGARPQDFNVLGSS